MSRDRVEQTAWIVAAIGVLGSAIGWAVEPRVFPFAWLAAVACWIGWPLGSIGLLLIHSISGGRWGYAIRPQLVFGVLTLPLVLPVVLPLLFTMHTLYPWAQPHIAIQFGNTAYLNRPFAIGRGALYLVVWLAIGGFVLRAVGRDDADLALYRLSPAGLILLMVTVTLAGIDSTMSLDPHFNSSIYGMMLAGEGVLFALAVATLIALVIAPPPRRIREDLGKLLLALLVLWGYFVFMQLLIAWNSDLAIDSPWYVLRILHGWAVVAWLVFILHFAVPFFLLLWPQIQGSRRYLGAICGMIILGEILNAWWLVVPAAGRALSWIDIAAVLAVGGLAVSLAFVAPRLRAMPSWIRQHG